MIQATSGGDWTTRKPLRRLGSPYGSAVCLGSTRSPAPRERVSVPDGEIPFAHCFAMCSGTEGELTGQISINELLIAMGEAPVEPIVLTPAAPKNSSLFGGPAALPRL